MSQSAKENISLTNPVNISLSNEGLYHILGMKLLQKEYVISLEKYYMWKMTETWRQK